MNSPSARPLSASLHHLAIASPNPRALADFYAQALGLELSDKNMLCAQGPGRRLLFVQGNKKTLAFAAYAVRDRAQLGMIRSRCLGLGVPVEEHIDEFFGPPAIMVEDPDGNRIAFGLPRDELVSPGGRTARLQHVVVASRNAERLSRFYQDCFGFLLSDNVVDNEGGLRTAFLRSSEEHHSFAVFQAAQCWFDHHCYEAGDWGLIRDWGDHFAALDIPVQWGPGRHGPGNNLFLFIHDLDGNWLEISAELEIVEPHRPVGIWKHEQKTLNSWGSAPLRS